MMAVSGSQQNHVSPTKKELGNDQETYLYLHASRLPRDLAAITSNDVESRPETGITRTERTRCSNLLAILFACFELNLSLAT